MSKEPHTTEERSTAATKKKSNAASNAIIAFFAVVLLVGVGVLAYPSVANWWNRMHQSRAVAGYVEQVESLEPQQRAKMLADAKAYNEELKTYPDRWHLEDDKSMLERYNKTLDVTGTGIMGYVSIPAIKVRLPIYHGTDESVLQIAIGHLTGSTLPVGGEGMHTVVSGHTGLPSAKLITDLDQLKKGDIFQFHVLDETLTYEVDQISVVKPAEMDKLNFEDGKDYATLVTCTPYGVNSHRLLVRGHRIANPVTPDSTTYDNPTSMLWTAVAAAGLLVLIVLLLAIWLVRRHNRRKLNDITPNGKFKHRAPYSRDHSA